MISSLTDIVNDNMADDDGELQPITGYGVAKIVVSGHPEFEAGNLVWGKTKWEEYSVLIDPDILFKIARTDVPLSYYAGILGKYDIWCARLAE